MAAPIVYEGVKRKYEGTLFNGIKFWVSHRVPIRSSILERIQDNGGKIVQLEKFADVLIDDHAKKGAAPRSLSWKYIDQSVARGELQNVEDFRIDRAGLPRPVGSPKPIRGIKVPYSKQDEQILVTWVLQQQKAGESAQGNRIYQRLAELYPQHTWQSWRDKWVKHFALVREEHLPPVLPELPPPAVKPSSVSEASPTFAAPPSTDSARPLSDKPQPEASRRKSHAKRKVFFTEGDDKLLTEYVKQRTQAGEKPSGNKIYQELEEEYPHHTFQSWRDRWVRHLSRRPPDTELHTSSPDVATVRLPLDTQAPLQAPPASSTPPHTVPDRKAGSSVGDPRSDRLKELNLKRKRGAAVRLIQRVWRGYVARRDLSRGHASDTETRAQAQGVPPQVLPASSTPPRSLPNHKAGPSVGGQRSNRLKELDSKRKLAAAARLIQRVWRGFVTRRGLKRQLEVITQIQPWAQGFLTRRTLGFTEAGITQDDRVLCPPTELSAVRVQHAVQEGTTPDTNKTAASALSHRRAVESRPPPSEGKTPMLTKEEFWRSFKSYHDLTGDTPYPWVQIGRRAVDIWALWQRATQEHHHPSRDWEAIAADLEFDWVAEPDAPGLVKGAFDAHLLDFENALREFEVWRAAEEAIVEDEEDGNGGSSEEGEDDDKLGSGTGEAHDGADGHGRDADHEELATEKEGASDDADSQTSGENFVSSPPLLGMKRARESSVTSYFGSFSKRPRYDPSSEIPATPEVARTGPSGRTPPLGAASGEITPTRRPRGPYAPEKPVHEGTEGQDDGSLLFTPSQQLRSESDAVTPPGRVVALPSSGTLYPPSAERVDEASDSSDEYESINAAAVPHIPRLARKSSVVDQRPSCRTLPSTCSTTKDHNMTNITGLGRPPP